MERPSCSHSQSLSEFRDQTRELLLCVGDLHGAGRRDPEALQRVLGDARLRVAFKLHEGDVVLPGDETHLFEAGKPADGHDVAVNTHTRTSSHTQTVKQQADGELTG